MNKDALIEIEIKNNFNSIDRIKNYCKNSSIISFKSYLQVTDTNNALLDNTYTQGVHYNTSSIVNNMLYYNVGPLKHIISTGHQISLVTIFNSIN